MMLARSIVCCVAMGLSSSGCNDDVATATDAAAPSDGGGDPWACLGRVTPVVPGGAMVTITVNAVAFSTGGPLVGVTAKACARTDVTCAMPHSMGVTDAMGSATLTGPVGAQGFDGYIELTGGTGSNEAVPTRMFPNPRLAAGMRAVTARVIERETFALLGSALMARLDATSGMITAAASDCNHAPAVGATISATPMPMGARQFYTGANGLPNFAATQTGPAGSGGLVNAPPGDYTLTAARVSPATRIGAAVVNVRGGYITSINVGPSP